MSDQDNSQNQELTPLQRAHLKLKGMRERGELVNVVRLNPVEKAQKNPSSLRAAITAHCWTCVGQGADPNPRQSVRDCNIVSCSLHPVRPWQKVVGKSADQMTEEEFEEAASEGPDVDDDPSDSDE